MNPEDIAERARSIARDAATAAGLRGVFGLVESIMLAAVAAAVREVVIEAPGITIEDLRTDGGAIVEDLRTV